MPALAFLLLVIGVRLANQEIGVPRRGTPGRCDGAAKFCGSRFYLGGSSPASGFARSGIGFNFVGILS